MLKLITPDKLIPLIVILINGIVFANSILHHPLSGYDSDENLKYIAVLSAHLPDQKESNQFFTPPLAYFFPSLAYRVCSSLQNNSSCILFGGHVVQFLNVVLSIGITLMLINISNILQPGNGYYKITALVFLGLPTVYYKTFSQVRAEPYVAFFTILLILVILKFLKKTHVPVIKTGLGLGVAMGLLVLSRQWGFLLFPALAIFALPLWIWKKEVAISYIKVLSIGLVIGFLIGGWFYIHLHQKYGSVTTFNRKTQSFSFSNQPPSFYRNTGLGNFLLFKSPTRKTFDNQFFPIFYSETWGDYWGYFVFVREKTLFGESTNKSEISPYLGRVNLTSVFPSLIMAGGLMFGIIHSIKALSSTRSNIDILASTLFTLMITSSFAGFTWFLITHPLDAKGVTIKATYMIQIFMILPFLTATFMEKIREYQYRLYNAMMVGILIVFIHNLPAMITRHWTWLL